MHHVSIKGKTVGDIVAFSDSKRDQYEIHAVIPAHNHGSARTYYTVWLKRTTANAKYMLYVTVNKDSGYLMRWDDVTRSNRVTPHDVVSRDVRRQAYSEMSDDDLLLQRHLAYRRWQNASLSEQHKTLTDRNRVAEMDVEIIRRGL